CGSDMHCSKVNYGYNEGISAIEDLGVSVYPNPATDELNITTQALGISYKLMSITGVSLQNGLLNQGNNTIPVNNIATGMYLLQLTDNSGAMKVTKIVKE
ncbi:MAG TPA: T9SS type A sorting domain-containing protein, partial [Candidatus Babeliaceae bacterium]|nr:T9SS type A sorting domain-containing protein [Candidatus Babeliaceae bacterium]